jgi:hypothetical protein
VTGSTPDVRHLLELYWQPDGYTHLLLWRMLGARPDAEQEQLVLSAVPSGSLHECMLLAARLVVVFERTTVRAMRDFLVQWSVGRGLGEAEMALQFIREMTAAVDTLRSALLR